MGHRSQPASKRIYAETRKRIRVCKRISTAASQRARAKPEISIERKKESWKSVGVGRQGVGSEIDCGRYLLLRCANVFADSLGELWLLFYQSGPFFRSGAAVFGLSRRGRNQSALQGHATVGEFRTDHHLKRGRDQRPDRGCSVSRASGSGLPERYTERSRSSGPSSQVRGGQARGSRDSGR